MRIIRLPFTSPKFVRQRCEKVVPPVPKPFDFGYTARRPLVPMSAVMMFLNKRFGEVISLIEDGKLRWVFDIRSENAKRREIRVLRQSLFEYVGLMSPDPELVETEREEFARIMSLILPRGVVLSPFIFNALPQKTCTRSSRSFHLKLRLPARSIPALRCQAFPREPVMRGTEIAWCFSCLNQHVLNLIRENSFRTVHVRRGPKASPLVTRESVVEFLRKRRMS